MPLAPNARSGGSLREAMNPATSSQPTPPAATLSARFDLVVCDVSDNPEPGLDSYSPFCVKVHRTLRWLRVPYSTRYGTQPADFKHLNPAQQVPVLIGPEGPISDSTEIVQRVARLAKQSLVPGLDSQAAADAWLLEELADTALNGFVVASRWADEDNWPRLCTHFFSTAPWIVRKAVAPQIRKRVLKALHDRDVTRHGLDQTWARLYTLLNQLEARTPRAGFFMGESLSIADISLFAQLRSMACDLSPRQRDMVLSRPNLAAYLNRVDRATAPSTVKPIDIWDQAIGQGAYQQGLTARPLPCQRRIRAVEGR